MGCENALNSEWLLWNHPPKALWILYPIECVVDGVTEGSAIRSRMMFGYMLPNCWRPWGFLIVVVSRKHSVSVAWCKPLAVQLALLTEPNTLHENNIIGHSQKFSGAIVLDSPAIFPDIDVLYGKPSLLLCLAKLLPFHWLHNALCPWFRTSQLLTSLAPQQGQNGTATKPSSSWAMKIYLSST